MDRFVSHDDLIETLGAYALDAMDPDEAEAVRRHLDECPGCAAEVAQHQQVAALLGNTGGEAPAHLWAEIAGKLDSARLPRGAVSSPTIPGPAAPRRHTGPPRALREITRRPWVLAAAAAVVAIGLLSVQVVRLNDRVGTLDALESSNSLSQLAQVALANPEAETVDLASATTSGRTDAEMVVLPSGSAYLVNKALPALPSSETYQLWGKTNGKLISLGVLGNSPKTIAFTLRPSSAYHAFVVTAEDAGGVVRTTHRPVATSGTLSF
jgi:anti-sigma factor RsiW